MLEMLKSKRSRDLNNKIVQEVDKENNIDNKIDTKLENLDKESLSEGEKSSKSDEKDFQYYGEEDLYYKEEKLEKKEIDEIKENIKSLRIQLSKFFNSESETVSEVIKRLKPIPSQPKKTINVRKIKLDDKQNQNNLEQNKENDVIRILNEERFKELLDLISKLTELSHFDIYYDTYNKILRDYGEGDLIKWKYRIVQDNQDNLKQYGDFTTDQMKEWNSNVNYDYFFLK